MLVGHLTMPVSTPVVQPPPRVENPEPVTRSVVLTPLQEPVEATVSAPLKNPNPQQPELRQAQRPAISVPAKDDAEPGSDAEASGNEDGPDGQASIGGAEQQNGEQTEQGRGSPDSGPDAESAPGAVEVGLDEQELEQVRALSARDREVRAHEQAHSAVGGALSGAPRFSFDRGPDGRQYAVAGEVSIDTTPVPNNPEATIRKAQQIRRAAQAPANPSAQDRQVAARAIQMELEARQELVAQRQESFQQDERSTAAIDMYEKLTKIGRSQDLFPDLEQVIDDRA